MTKRIMRHSLKTSWILIGLLFITSCGNREGDGAKLPKVDDSALTDALDSLSAQTFDSFFTKVSTKYQDTSRKVSFKTMLRIVADSAVGISVSYANLPIMSAVITPDSLKLSNKREKCYLLESQRYFKESFGVDFTHRNIEEIMMGLPVGYDKNAEYHRVKDPYAYIISSHSKKDALGMGDASKKEMVFYYTLTKDLKNLASTRIESEVDSTVVMIDYQTRQDVDGFMSPNLMKITIITPRQEISIEMEYNKPRINQPEEIYFVIPESYGTCN
jgi:hypothetical protein